MRLRELWGYGIKPLLQLILKPIVFLFEEKHLRSIAKFIPIIVLPIVLIYWELYVYSLVSLIIPFLYYLKNTLLNQKFSLANWLHIKYMPVSGMFIAYFFLTFLFSLAYYSSVNLDLTIIDTNNGNAEICSFIDCLYFSFVTGTSLGYGDFAPNHFFTKLLSILEISTGPIFLIAIFSIAFSQNTCKMGTPLGE